MSEAREALLRRDGIVVRWAVMMIAAMTPVAAVWAEGVSRSPSI